MPEASYAVENRFLYLKSPFDDGDLLLTGFTGEEGMSRLFSFRLDFLAENRTNIAFDKILGQQIGFGLSKGDIIEKRPFHGIVNRFVQLSRDKYFTHYQADVVPALWLLTQNYQSQIFQNKQAPDIIKKVLSDQGIQDVKIQLQNTYQTREYCVQYRETDFNFISRLMEEEGIFYFFTFEEDKHTLVLGDTPQAHPDVPVNSKLDYEDVRGGTRDEERISLWEKIQEIGSGKFTTRDYYFEQPDSRFDANTTVIPTVQVGKVSHKLNLANGPLEIYDYPAEHFPSTGAAKDNSKVRMEQTEQPMILIRGASNYVQMTAGSKFNLQGHFNGDGQYVIVSVNHEGREGHFRSGEPMADNHYGNYFTCIPFALPFRPSRVTPRPFVHGCQTAVVTGPSGEEIYTDKYGRVKVLFHWDRLNKADENSSCWIRVATTWAGKQWGAISIPRIGHEVIVDFTEGDPDRPIIVGSVYNADLMPSYTLPDNKTRSGVKTRSTIGGGGFNEIRFEDKKDSEQLFINAQKDLDMNVGNIARETIGKDWHQTTGQDLTETIGRDHINGAARDFVHNIGRDHHCDVSGKAAYKVGGSYSLNVSGNAGYQYGGNEQISVGGNLHIKAGGQIVLDAGAGLTISVGGNHVTISPAGVTIVGTMVMINSGGAALSASSPNLVAPLKAAKALLSDTAVPGAATFYTQIGMMTAAQLAKMAASGAPTHDPDSTENKDKKDWVEVELIDDQGKPAAGVAYQVTLPDGSVSSGSLDEKGFVRIEGIDPGQVKITFPDLDKEAWEPN